MLQWSDEMYAIFEVDSDAQLTLGEFLNFVHVDDRQQAKEAIEKGTDSEYIFRIITGKGNEKVVKGVSKTEFSEQKLIIQCYGTCQDISGESSNVGRLMHAASEG